MAIWRKLNAETGEYEEIPGASTSSGGSESGGSTGDTTVTLPDLKGKTIIFMGDSYTVGMSAMLKSMATEFNAVDDNRGVVGSTICGTYDTAPYPFWIRTDLACEEYVTNGTTDTVGAIVFMGGANDPFSPQRLGSGINETDKNTIFGAMHSLMNKFRNTFPGAPIFVVLQPSTWSQSVASITTDADAHIKGFDDLAQLQGFDDYQYSVFATYKKETIVEQVARFYGCHIIDCCFDWYSALSSSDRAKYWASDKTHLTPAGYQDITNRLRSKMIEVLA